MSFVLKKWIILKYGKMGFVSKTRHAMFQIQEVFENGEPDIVLKTVKGFNIKRTLFIILISENNFKLGIVVFVMLNKMLVIDLTFGFYFQYRLES